jgi:hypothetical protein
MKPQLTVALLWFGGRTQRTGAIGKVLEMRLFIESPSRGKLTAGTQFPVPKWLAGARIGIAALSLCITASCSLGSASTRVTERPEAAVTSETADDLLVVDCLLPGRIIQLGQRSTYVARGQPIKTTALDCRIRGGKYVAYDRANYQTAREVWLADAEKGDSEAQNYLGEIYERGLGIAPDYKEAATWYLRAAEQGYAPAQMNLGKLYESGRGVPKDMDKALFWYRQAAGLPNLQPDPALQPLPASAVEARGTQHPPDEPQEPPGAIKKPPEIELIEPIVPETRGIALVSVAPQISERLIVGRVSAPNGLVALTINDQDTSTEANGMFRARVPVSESGSLVTIVAIDKAGQRGVRKFDIKPAEAAPPPANFGHYHALVIGNNKYTFLPSLQTARADAHSVGGILRTKYNFEITALFDANRYQILTALNKLRETLTEDDNLLIYYAGHGELDKVNDRGYWLPVDAERDSTANWISNVALTDILNAMSARHILVVADSCYSGTLTRSVQTELSTGQTEEARITYIRTVLKKRSRTALTSGGLQPVLDAGNEGHSVFANAFIDSLKSSKDSMMEGQRVFLEVAARVTQAAYDRRFEQVPQYAPIKGTRHEAGDFFFVPTRAAAGGVPAADLFAGDERTWH